MSSCAHPLSAILAELRKLPGCSGLGRISVALYDRRTETLHAVAASDALLEQYQVPLDEVPSLAILATGDEPRVVDDLALYGNSRSPHTSALREAGYRSSLTFPVNRGGELIGFVFFNATQPHVFTPSVSATLSPLVAELVDAALARRLPGV